MNEQIDLDFCFKGSRNYVQGPDIFDRVVSYIYQKYNKISDIKYSAYAMLHKNATLHLTKKIIKSDYSIISSVISFVTDDIKYYAVISENNKAIECSNDYSEEVVEKKSKISDNSILFVNTLSESYTEVVVSMNKHYLNQTIEENGKWIVTKFDYFRLDDILSSKNQEIRIELLQNLNNKLTKSSLFLNDKKVGHLYFSLIPKES